MPRIRCLYLDCTFLDDTYCTAPNVEIDPDMGCTTYLPLGEDVPDEGWDEDENLDDWESDELDLDDIDDDDEDDVDDEDEGEGWMDEI